MVYRNDSNDKYSYQEHFSCLKIVFQVSKIRKKKVYGNDREISS